MEDIKTINNFAIDELLPDITFLLNLPLDVAQSRLRGKKDRLEQEDIDFFIRTSQAYLQLAQDNPERFVIIDATQPIPKELNQIMDVILSRLKTN